MNTLTNNTNNGASSLIFSNQLIFSTPSTSLMAPPIPPLGTVPSSSQASSSLLQPVSVATASSSSSSTATSSSTSYRSLNNNTNTNGSNNKTAYLLSTQTPSTNSNNNNGNSVQYSTKRLAFNTTNNNNSNNPINQKQFQAINVDTVSNQSTQQQQQQLINNNNYYLINGNINGKLYHSNSVESLISDNNNIIPQQQQQQQLQLTSTVNNNNSNNINIRKSAFQILKPKAQQPQQYTTIKPASIATATITSAQQPQPQQLQSLPSTTNGTSLHTTPSSPSLNRFNSTYSKQQQQQRNNQYEYPTNSILNDQIDTPNDVLFNNNNTNDNNEFITDRNNHHYHTQSLINANFDCVGVVGGGGGGGVGDFNYDLDCSSTSLSNYESKYNINNTTNTNSTTNNYVFNNNTYVSTSSSSNNNQNEGSNLLMNSLQLFSHFDVQSILFNYNEIKLKKDSLHTSLNIRTGASAASRQGSMENLNKIQSQTGLVYDKEYSSNGSNSNTSSSNCLRVSVSSSPRPSIVAITNQIHQTNSSALLNEALNGGGGVVVNGAVSNGSLCSELVEPCPYFKIEAGGDTFKGLGLVRESQRRFMKLNSITILDKTSNVFKKDICEHIDSNNYEPFAIEYQDYGAYFYRYYFFNQEHANYFGIDKDVGPVAISVKRDKVINIDNQHRSEYVYRFIMLNTLRGSIAEDHIPTKQSSISNTKGISHKEIINYLIPQLDINCLKVADSKANEKLLQLDEQCIIKNYKVGVLLCKTGQSTEEEMYNNNSTPAFDEFLSLLGERITLKGFSHYKGGLDTKTDTTGTHSVHTKFRDKEIMFHVSTLLPFTVNDKQQLTRKRHIGNDVVTIIFQEPGSLPFSPKAIRSHFQHIFIIVRVFNPNTPNTQYSVAVSYNKDIPQFGPPLPKNPLFVKSREFTEFLLSKIINAENAGLKCEKFTQMRMRARNGILKDLALNYVTKTNLESSHRFGLFNFGSIKQKKLRSKSLQIFTSSDTLQLSGGIFWSASVEDYNTKPALNNCFFGISRQAIIVVEIKLKCVLFYIQANSIIGWTMNEPDNSLALYFDQGEFIIVNLKSRVELHQVVKRLEYFTRGCKTIELSLDKKDYGQLGFSIHHDGVVTEVEPYSLAYYRGLKPGTRIVRICDNYVRLLTHEKMLDLLRKTNPLKLLLLPPNEDGSPKRGLDDNFSIYSYLSTCSQFNERPIDLNNSQQQQQQQQLSSLNQRYTNNNNNVNKPQNSAYTNGLYFGYDNINSTTTTTKGAIYQQPVNTALITTTTTTTTTTNNNVGTPIMQHQQQINIKNNTYNSSSTSSMNRLQNDLQQQQQEQNEYEFDNQNNRISPTTLINNNIKANPNTNLEWTKLVQTATKAFENAHRSSDSLYYSDLLYGNNQNETNGNKIITSSNYTSTINELKENLCKLKLELDQEKLENKKYKSKMNQIIEENLSLKQELTKIKDENRLLHQKFCEFSNSNV